VKTSILNGHNSFFPLSGWTLLRRRATSREDLFDVVLTLLGRQAGDVFDVRRILKYVLKRGI
jgi:hypothetical protein